MLKKELDAAAKKEILGLLFKKYIIKSAAKNAAAASRIQTFFYAPFDKIISEEENSILWRQKKKKSAHISSRHMDAFWLEVYLKPKLDLELIFKPSLTDQATG